MTTSQTFASRDFSAKTLRQLGARGIQVVGTQFIPGTGEMPMAAADAQAGYLVDDNGTGKVWTFGQVIAAAR